jgi:HD-GYP domain-containing protein (c-di-GMP phosphodiesterase class II)
LHFSYTQNDTLQKRLPPGAKLIYSTFTIPMDQNSILGCSATTGIVLNIPDVYKLESIVPYRFNPKFDVASNYRTRSLLAIPLKNIRAETIGVLQIINAQNEKGEIIPFTKDDEGMMSHFASTAAVALERAQMMRTIILRMIRMAELRDPGETGAHVNRVGAYAVELYEQWAQKKGIPQREIEAKRDVLRMAAMLHDVGKVAISDLILKKPARLVQDEYEIMKQHTLLGARLFLDQRSEFDEAAAEVAMNHHEWWNGLGYPGHVDVQTGLPLEGFADLNGRPRGKRGNEIPLFGRIVAIADVYDALTSRRVYKEPFDEVESLKILEEGAGEHFDPELIEDFFSWLDVIHSIRERYPDEETSDTPERTTRGLNQ